MQKVKFDTIVSAYRIKYYMQKKKKYTRKRLQKEHVNGWKNALVRQHLSLPFHGLRGGGTPGWPLLPFGQFTFRWPPKGGGGGRR